MRLRRVAAALLLPPAACRRRGRTARCGRISWPCCRAWTRSRRGRRRCGCRWGAEVAFGTLRDHCPRLPEHAADRAARERRVPGDPGGRPRHARTETRVHGLDVRLQPLLSALEHPVYDVWPIECAEPLEPEPPPPPPLPPWTPRCRRRQRIAAGREGRAPAEGQAQAAQVGGAADLDRAEAAQVIGQELRVEQGEAAGAQPRRPARPGRSCWSRGPARTCSRRRTPPPSAQPVQAAGQAPVAPDLDAVGMAARGRARHRARSASR